MKKITQYDGWELESFDQASNFRRYQMEKIKNFSDKNKTLDKSFKNIKTTVEEKIKKK